MTGRLDGKTALVTGGGSGFGAGIARRFAGEGARVLVVDINADAAAAVAAEIGAASCGADVADAASVAAMAAAAKEHLGALDILVNNAGVTHQSGPLEDVDEESFDRVMAVNNKAVYLAARAFVPAMKAAGKGCILNIASTAGVSPRPNLSWYNASKGWMITATRAMAVELAPYGVRETPSIRWPERHRFWQVSWARTRRRCALSSCPPFPSAGSRSPRTLPTPPSISAPTRPRWSPGWRWKWMADAASRAGQA